MESLTSAEKMAKHYNQRPPTMEGHLVHVQYSKHQQLTVDADQMNKLKVVLTYSLLDSETGTKVTSSPNPYPWICPTHPTPSGLSSPHPHPYSVCPYPHPVCPHHFVSSFQHALVVWLLITKIIRVAFLHPDFGLALPEIAQWQISIKNWPVADKRF